jgi:uncharacterized UBP type Zn finger protein
MSAADKDALIAMGFTNKQVELALNLHKDFQPALDWLLSHSNDEILDEK